MLTLVNHRPAVQIHNAVRLTVKLFALAYLNLLALHLPVVLNVLFLLNAPPIRLASIRNALTHALLIHVAIMPSVVCLIIAQSVLVRRSLPEMPSANVIPYHVSSKSNLTAFYAKTAFNTVAKPVEPEREEYRDPCVPSPCGPNAECRNGNGVPSCTCLPTFIGQPPSCRPECTINSECRSQEACINQKCRDPCQGACGLNTICRVINHTPSCACVEGFIGNPFINCNPKPPERKISLPLIVVKIIKLSNFIQPPARLLVMILVILPHVVPMHNAITDNAFVLPSIMATPTPNVVPNVYLIRTVHAIVLVYTTNALILVQAYAAPMPSVR